MTSGGNFDSLPDVIKNLMESPEIADIIKNAGLASNEKQPVNEPSPKEEGFSLSPEMMAKLPSVISALQGMGIGSSKSGGGRDINVNDIASRLPQAMSALSSMGIGEVPKRSARGEDKNREALLKALKPYMGERKRGAIDTMLGIGSLAEIMKMLMGGQ